MVSTVLAGPWRARATTPELRREFIEPDFDATDWTPLAVPGHWAAEPGFEARTSLLYRTSFTLPAGEPSTGERHWLVFDGIWARADVWLDGDYLGPTDTWFTHDQFEITEQATARDEHVLAVEVMSPRPDPDSGSRDLRGIFGDTTIVGHENPGGIWRPVRVETTGPVRSIKNRMVCTEAGADQAVVHMRSELLSVEPRPVTIVTTVRPPGGAAPIEHRREHHLAAGSTVLEWDVRIADPELWWPWSLGEQPLYRVSVAVEAGGSISDMWERVIGLRTVKLDKWALRVNGERLFVKGADRWPTAPPGRTDAGLADQDVAITRELGLDLLRIESHVAPAALYEAADRHGVMLWQDLPLRGEARRSVRGEAVNAAHRLVDELGSHPSIVLWCGHYDSTGTTTGTRPATAIASRREIFGVARQQLPTWTKSVLDRLVARAFRVADPSRPVIASSGTWPSAPAFDGTDTHLRFGWNNGTGRDLEHFARRIPRMVRWVSSFGGQSIPHNDEVKLGKWPPNLGVLADRYGLSERGFREYLAPGSFRNAAEWIEASQAYQATLLRRQIEALRRLKYSPTGGFTFSALADGRPAISFAIHDHLRRPKAAVEAVRAACRPVIVVADRLPATLVHNDPVLVDVHVVNDERKRHAGLRVDAELTWSGGRHRWAWRGAVDADAVSRVGSINWIVPDAPGPVRLDITVRSGDTTIADNVYQAEISQLP